MQTLNEAIQIITGGKSGGYYLAGFIFSLAAIFLSVYHHSLKRNKNSNATPYRFSWQFFIFDNLKRALAGLIVMFFLFRLFDLSDVKYMIGVGFVVAFSLDKIIQWLIKKTSLTDFLKIDREKLVDKIEAK